MDFVATRSESNMYQNREVKKKTRPQGFYDEKKTGKSGVGKICGRIKVLIYVLAVMFVNTMWWSCGLRQRVDVLTL